MQIDAFIRLQILRCGELKHLALGNRGRGIGQDLQNAHVVRVCHQLERAGEKVIADQNRRFVVPQQVGGRATASLGTFIDHVVMQQRRGMDEFDSRGEMHVIGTVITTGLGRRQRQHRTQAFAARLDQMRGHFGNPRRVF